MSRRRTLVVAREAVSGIETVDAQSYLADETRFGRGEVTVLNLYDGSRYLSEGYYVSLLADARGHDVVPTIDTLEVLSNVTEALRVLEDVGVSTFREAARIREMDRAQRVDVVSVFGRVELREATRAAAKIYRRLPIPIVRLSFLRAPDGLHLYDLAPLSFADLDADGRARLLERVRSGRVETEHRPERARASLALLFDPDDPFKPSYDETLRYFERVADRMGLAVRRIGPNDIERVAEHDALFIRTLTGPDIPSFRFAQRAESLGLPVIDSTRSILRCGNKVYLAELFERAKIPTPDTVRVLADTSYHAVESALGSPFVLKVPDGSFSAAVFKIANAEAWAERVVPLFEASPILIAQRWMPTPFDWRIGVLDGRPLYAARYWMVPGHWQIRRAKTSEKSARDGRTEAVPIERVPTQVKRVACKAARLIGDGFYGIDIKETSDGPFLIEVNDNPDLHHDYEDQAEGERVYEELVAWFLERIDQDSASTPPPPPGSEVKHPPIGTVRARTRDYRAYEVVGMEVEYALVDDDLEPVHAAEQALAALAGRPASEADHGAVAYSNEFFDHLIELKTVRPLANLAESETILAEGVERLARILEDRGVRPMPTSMHPWFDPKNAVRWSRSGRAVYDTYARLFDTSTHGWANVQSCQVNLPLGREHEAVAMMNAAALLVPYLPAIAASSPMYGGVLQPATDNRLAFILQHQDRIPETMGSTVPEYVESMAGYRRDVLRPIYRAVDQLPDARAIRHEWLNARGAVFKLSRRSMEVRVIDSQECPKMDTAIAAYVRGALHDLSADLMRGRIPLPHHARLVDDLEACVRDGSRARVFAPHVVGLERDEQGRVPVSQVTAAMLARAERRLRKSERPYLELVEQIRVEGTLSERIRDAVEPATDRIAATREIYRELCDCLRHNRPWRGRRASGELT